MEQQRRRRAQRQQQRSFLDEQVAEKRRRRELARLQEAAEAEAGAALSGREMMRSESRSLSAMFHSWSKMYSCCSTGSHPAARRDRIPPCSAQRSN